MCDLPRELDDAAYTVLDRSDLAVIVVPAEVRACAAARLLSRRVLERGVPSRLVVRGPAPGGLRPNEVADAVGLPLLTSMRPEPHLARTLERGDFWPPRRGPLVAAAQETLTTLAGMRLRSAATQEARSAS